MHSLWSPSSGQHYLNLEWKVNCVDKSIVAGYNISYCLIASMNSTECDHETLKSKIIVLEDEEITQTHLTYLKSWSLYKITIALLSDNRLGPDSDFIVVRTAESGELILLVLCYRLIVIFLKCFFFFSTKFSKECESFGSNK